MSLNNIKVILQKYKILAEAVVCAVGINMIFNYTIVSVYSLIFAILFYTVFGYLKKQYQIDNYMNICAILLTIFTTMGKIDYWLMADIDKIYKIMRLGFIASSAFLIFRYIVGYIYVKYDFYIEKKGKMKKLSPNIIFALTFIMIGLAWFLILLVEYPGIITFDTLAQIYQFTGERALDNFNPLANTLWLGLQYHILRLIGLKNNNHIFAIISMVQLLCIDFIVSLQIRFLYRHLQSYISIAFSGLFYIFVTYHAFYSVMIGKDTCFSGVTLLLLLLLLKYFENNHRKYLIGIFFGGMLFCIFRGNGYPAYIFFMFFAIFYGIKKKDKLFVGTVIGVSIVSALIVGGVYNLLGVAKRPYAETLSIPIQQIAYVLSEGNELKEEESTLLNNIVDVDKMKVAYTDWLSDPVKSLFNNENYFKHHKVDYLLMYLKLGGRYPKQYLYAYVKQTYGYYSPELTTYPYLEGVHENNMGIERTPILSSTWVKRVSKMTTEYVKLPLYGSFCSIATYAWTVVIGFIYCIRKRNGVCLMNYALLLGIWIGLLIGTPVNAEFRYIYPLILTFPLNLFMPYCTQKEKSSLK